MVLTGPWSPRAQIPMVPILFGLAPAILLARSVDCEAEVGLEVETRREAVGVRPRVVPAVRPVLLRIVVLVVVLGPGEVGAEVGIEGEVRGAVTGMIWRPAPDREGERAPLCWRLVVTCRLSTAVVAPMLGSCLEGMSGSELPAVLLGPLTFRP